MTDRESTPRPGAARLPPTVIGLGLVSLLTDASSEAIFPLLPAFLVSLGASGAFIGLVEGAADLVASVLKIAAGLLADRARRRKPLVLLGYGLSTVVRPLVAFAAAPWHVLAVRVGDRVGKGLRTSPRASARSSIAMAIFPSPQRPPGSCRARCGALAAWCGARSSSAS